ncbi:hypothetical protein F0562_032996 [Nyssa sinensis]|uniref:DUF7912 domain-containing protein n=1 Tax=Nyssa sinensis TaxID=561372 RepID=A0A5J5ATY9_9ASTE|nr:hypothetical protein F0562_032996 [Nyssa sinensis]
MTKMTSSCSSRIHALLSCSGRRSVFASSPSSAIRVPFSTHHHHPTQPPPTLQNPNSPSSSTFHLRHWVGFPLKPTSTFSSSTALRFLNTSSSEDEVDEEVEPIDSWEEEDEAEPEIGDGGDGGGVVLQNCPWGARALSVAHEVLQQFGDDMKLFSFKTTPRGYIYVRLDKLPNKYGCPSMEEIEIYSHQYKKRLDEAGAAGEIPDDLALEVSSPGAERLLKVPDDLYRFKDMPMRVSYVEEDEGARFQEKSGVFFLDSIETESGSCMWRLADVKENRDPSAKGRQLSRKQKDWRLKLPHAMFKRVTLYLD